MPECGSLAETCNQPWDFRRKCVFGEPVIVRTRYCTNDDDIRGRNSLADGDLRALFIPERAPVGWSKCLSM